MTKSAKKYYKKVLSYLPMFSQYRKDLIKQLQRSMEEFSQAHPDSTFQDFETAFGTPRAFANTLLDEYTPNQLRKDLFFTKRNCIILGCVLLTTILFVCFAIYYYNNFCVDIYTEITIYE